MVSLLNPHTRQEACTRKHISMSVAPPCLGLIQDKLLGISNYHWSIFQHAMFDYHRVLTKWNDLLHVVGWLQLLVGPSGNV